MANTTIQRSDTSNDCDTAACTGDDIEVSVCRLCKIHFNSVQGLLLHRCRHPKCRICDQAVLDLEALESHEMYVHPQANWKRPAVEAAVQGWAPAASEAEGKQAPQGKSSIREKLQRKREQVEEKRNSTYDYADAIEEAVLALQNHLVDLFNEAHDLGDRIEEIDEILRGCEKHYVPTDDGGGEGEETE